MELYSCGCGTAFALDQLFYCSGCQAIKCLYCVNEEIVAYACPTCLENVPSAEAAANRNCCTRCFACPQCACAAKSVTQAGDKGGACYLRCIHCAWDSRAVAIAPSVADLLVLAREHERGGAETVAYQQRLTEFKRSVEEAAAQLHKQQQSAKARKTQQLLVHTPAKTKFFAATGKNSPLRVNLASAFDAAAAPASASAAKTGSGGTGGAVDAIDRLERALEAKHDEQFGSRARDAAAPVAAATSSVVADAFPVRQPLITSTSKHCNKCDKLLVKPDVNPQNAMEFKRLHVALLFVAHVHVVALDPAAGMVKLVFGNPMKNALTLVLAPSAKARWTLVSPVELTVAGAPGRTPTRMEVAFPVSAGGAGADVLFALGVDLAYEGVLGPQKTRYDVSRVK